MSDIDFDELDKAVNNIVKKTDNTNDTSSDTATSASEQNEQNDELTNHKPKGRFMDVMHPSADMTSKDNKSSGDQLPNKPKPSYQHGQKNISPLEDSNLAIASVGNSSQKDTSDHPAVKSDWPDPIEAAHAKDEAGTDEDHAISSPITKDDEDTGSEKSEDEANESPAPLDTSSLFLPNTEVEKRPLGGFSSSNNPHPQLDNAETQTPDNAVGITDKTTNTPNQTINLPPELEANLVAIEERDTTAHPQTHTSESSLPQTPPEMSFEETPPSETKDTEDKTEVQSSPSVIESQEPAPNTLPLAASKNSDVTSLPKKGELSGLLAAGSIPQQYKTAKPTDEPAAASHPIFFDADHFDKSPGTTPLKKRSRASRVFQWIFIIVGLLLLGGTLGAALFIFVSSN